MCSQVSSDYYLFLFAKPTSFFSNTSASAAAPTDLGQPFAQAQILGHLLRSKKRKAGSFSTTCNSRWWIRADDGSKLKGQISEMDFSR